jgi:hypothetical protein
LKAYTISVKDISALHKTVENHLAVVKDAITYGEEWGNKIIQWVSDAGGELCAM